LRKVRPIISILAAPCRAFTLPGQSPRNGHIVLSLLRDSAQPAWRQNNNISNAQGLTENAC
jgi:hypothetical protein